MPNCFQLTPKGETEPATLVSIDEALCKHFSEPVHPKFWFRGWYDSIGFGLACGYDWDKCREVYADSPSLLKVIDFLEKHYDYRAWAEVGRR